MSGKYQSQSLFWQLGCYLLAATLLFYCFAPLKVLRAESIRELMSSRAYKAYKRARSRDTNSAKYLTPGSNFAQLFTQKDGPQQLIEWLDLSATGLSLGKYEQSKYLEYVKAYKELRTPGELVLISLSLLVPHPKYKSTVELGLVDAFLELKPPKLKITYEENLKIAGTDAFLYHTASGACSLWMPLARSGVISMQTKDCKDRQALIELSEKLNLKRLNKKLNS